MKKNATVAEVLEALQQLPQDASVYWGCDGLIYIEDDKGEWFAELNPDEHRTSLLKRHDKKGGAQ